MLYSTVQEMLLFFFNSLKWRSSNSSRFAESPTVFSRFLTPRSSKFLVGSYTQNSLCPPFVSTGNLVQGPGINCSLITAHAWWHTATVRDYGTRGHLSTMQRWELHARCLLQKGKVMFLGLSACFQSIGLICFLDIGTQYLEPSVPHSRLPCPFQSSVFLAVHSLSGEKEVNTSTHVRGMAYSSISLKSVSFSSMDTWAGVLRSALLG